MLDTLKAQLGIQCDNTVWPKYVTVILHTATVKLENLYLIYVITELSKMVGDCKKT